MKRKNFLCLLMVVFVLAASFAGAETSEEYFWSGPYEYRLLEDGTAELTHVHNKSQPWFYDDIPEPDPSVSIVDGDTIIIPDTLDGYTVSSIGSYAICINDFFLYKVIIPVSVVHIGQYPFTGTIISEFLVSPDHPAFEVIDGFLFEKGGKKLIAAPYISGVCIIPEGTEIIGEFAMGFNRFSNIKFPESLVKIEENGLSENNSEFYAREINIPDNVIELEGNPFADWSNFHSKIVVSSEHPTLEVIDDFLINKKDHKLLGYYGKKQKCVIPDGVEIIGEAAFFSSGVKTVIVPEGVKEICPYAFTNIEFIELPSTLTHISEYSIQSSKMKNLVIPEGVTSMDDVAIWCSKLSSITLPQSLQNCRSAIFDACDSLKNYTVVYGSPAWQWVMRRVKAYGRSSYNVKTIYYVSQITLSDTEITIQKNRTKAVKATIDPKNANNKKVEWLSTDPDVATVNNSGRIKGIAAGTCDIICRALDGGKVEAVCHVIVVEEGQ